MATNNDQTQQVPNGGVLPRGATPVKATIENTSKVFTIFDRSDDIVANDKQQVTLGLWANNAPTFVPTANNYTAITGYAATYTGSDGNAEFSVAYGEYDGAAGDDATYPLKAIYNQYRTLLVDNPNTENRFVVYGDATVDDAFFISIARSRLRQALDPGNWQLVLADGDTTLHLIDDSSNPLGVTSGGAGRRYNIVSGSVTDGIHTAASSTTYGYVYPDMGIMMIDKSKLSGVSATSLSTFQTALVIGGEFTARSEEYITSTHYFVRIKNKEYNFSNNPSFVTGSNNEFQNSDFYLDPKTYVTSIGLYDSQNRLLAVAKTSQPIQKSYDREVLVKVKVDY